MADDVPVTSLARAREQKISELSQYFANDDLSLDELERRIERVYRAGNVLELAEITADLRAVASAAEQSVQGSPRAARALGSFSAPVRAKMLAIMGETRRIGRWPVPQRLDVTSLLSDTRLDLTQAVLGPGITDIHLRAFWSSCRIIVSPGMRVINEMHAVAASVTSGAYEMTPPGAEPAGGPVIRLSGTALMAEVKVIVRTRETVVEDDDDQE